MDSTVIKEGFCPICNVGVEFELMEDTTKKHDGVNYHEKQFEAECPNCEYTLILTAAISIK
ncbi:MAG: hypothetical protein ACXADW_21855 [Candidatus Hodarchaeales archaeon]|jgi:hypothetical protein